MFVRSAGAGRSTTVRQTATAILAGAANRPVQAESHLREHRSSPPAFMRAPCGASARECNDSARVSATRAHRPSGQGSASRPQPRACRARVGGWSIIIVAPLLFLAVIYSDDRPRSAMSPLRLAERVERRLGARTVRQRLQQPKRFAHVRADPISVFREAHVDDASPSIDIHAHVGWTQAQELTSQPLAPVRCAPHPSGPKLACTRTLFCRNCHHGTFQFEVGGMPRGAEHRSSRVPRQDTSAAAPHRLAGLLRTEHARGRDGIGFQ